MKKFLVAFDKCKDSLSADELCNLSEQVLSKRYPDCSVIKAPLTDGGEGFAKVLTHAVGEKLHRIDVKNSIGETKSAVLGICDHKNLPREVLIHLGLPLEGKLGIVEMAQAAGLADLSVADRNPWKTSTFGVGEMIREASSQKVDAIILGIGGSSTNDLGMGALAALGGSFTDQQDEKILNPFPLTWKDIQKVNFDSLVDIPPLFVACDVDNPLLGKNGATAKYGPQKGLPRDQIRIFEESIKNLQSLLSSISTKTQEFSELKGSGAAGGIGYGLSLTYNVKLISGFDLVSKWFDLPKLVQDVDFVLTGEGRFDQTSLNGKGPFELLSLANKKSKFSLLLAGSAEFDSVHQISNEFNNCEILQFGRDDWSLEQNLFMAESRFSETLNNFSFPDDSDKSIVRA